MGSKRNWPSFLVATVIIGLVSYLTILDPVGAQVNGTGEQVNWPDQGKSFALMIVQLIFYTGLIIVLIVLLARFLAKRERQWGDQATFHHLGGTPLGPNKSVQLLKLGDKVYVIGVSEQITLLDVIADPEEIKRLEQRRDGFDTASFKGRWSALFNRVQSGGQGEPLQPGLKEEDDEQQAVFKKVLEQSLKQQQEKREQYSSMLSGEGSAGATKDDKDGHES